MNAYELAEMIEDAYPTGYVKDAADMLREQAEEIEELKKRLEETRLLYLKQLANKSALQTNQCKDCGEINPAEIHTCSPQKNAEPVAMRYDFDGYGWMYIDSGSGSDWQTREQGVFLYTAPQTKPLNDDEIKKIADSVCHAWKKNGVGKMYINDFVRAIEKEHGIK